jgi:hypothetical protein
MVSALLPACGDCSDEIDAARAFLENNRACQVDDDCVVVGTGCTTFANGLCGQAPLNRRAAESAEWKHLRDDLVSCEDECSNCLAQLIARCTESVCGGPR